MCIRIGLLIYILIYKHPIQVYGAIRIYIYIKRNRNINFKWLPWLTKHQYYQQQQQHVY